MVPILARIKSENQKNPPIVQRRQEPLTEMVIPKQQLFKWGNIQRMFFDSKSIFPMPPSAPSLPNQPWTSLKYRQWWAPHHGSSPIRSVDLSEYRYRKAAGRDTSVDDQVNNRGCGTGIFSVFALPGIPYPPPDNNLSPE